MVGFDEPPRRFGRYELIEQLAIGGMGELYRAVLHGPSGFSKTVAIKKILPELNKDQRFREMFLQEGRIMANLNHRNVLQVFEMGEIGSELYLCLEFIRGCNLARLLNFHRVRERFIDPALAAGLVRDLADGLRYLHELKDEVGQNLHVVHRDVSPANILVSVHGDVKLGDFGVAKSMAGMRKTAHGQIKGTLPYISPEQARGDEVGPASDLFALGAVLFEMLSMRRFNSGKDLNELLRNALRPAWRPISIDNPAVPEALEEIVKRAVRPEPERRFPSAAAFAEVLSQFIENQRRAPRTSDLTALMAEVCGVQDLEAPEYDEEQYKTIRSVLSQTADQPTGPGEDSVGNVAIQTVSIVADALDRPVRPRRRFGLTGRGWLVLLAIGLAIGLTIGLVITRGALFGPTSVGLKTRPAGDARPAVLSPTPVVESPPVSDDLMTPLPIGPGPDAKVKENGPKTGPHRSRPAKSRTKPRLAARSRQQIKGDLNRIDQALRKRGVRSGDVPEVDRLKSRIKRALRAGRLAEAGRWVSELDEHLAGVRVDRAFVDHKLRRLQKMLKDNKMEDRFAERLRKALDLALNDRFAESNALINRIFLEIKPNRKP